MSHRSLPLLGALALGIGALALGVPATAEPTSARTLNPFPVHEKTLANGLQVVAVPMGQSGLVAHWLSVRTGSRDEYEPGRTGFAHFFEHMMFYGTENYSQKAYSDTVTRMGADSNAFTSPDATVYFLNVAAEDLERVMEIESDRFKNLSYAKQAFQTEAGAVYGEYRKNRSSPFFAMYEAMLETAFDKHTYGHTTMGYERDIKEMPNMYDYSRTFFSRYYRPDNAILVVAGDVDPANVFAKAEKYYGDWQRGYQPPKVEVEPEQTAPRRVDVAYPGRALPMVWVGYKHDAFNANDRVYVASRVLAELAFGETSEIYRRLVLEEQVLQNIGVAARITRDPGLWVVTAVIKDPRKIDEILAEIEKTVVRFRDNPPAAEAVEAVKSNMRYSHVMDLDSPSAVARTIAYNAAVTGSPGDIEAMYRTLAQVTPADVQEAARKYLVEARRTTGVLKSAPAKKAAPEGSKKGQE